MSKLKNFLCCKKISTAILRAKKMLIEREKRSGLYENFGQDEIRMIDDEFIDSSCYTDEMNNARAQLREFDEWCMTYEGKEE